MVLPTGGVGSGGTVVGLGGNELRTGPLVLGLQLVEKLGAEGMTNANVHVAFKETCHKGSKSELWL